MTSSVKTGYVPVNGLKLYYEVHGAGEPLILLHGGLGSIEMFAELLPAFSKTRKVIAADLQGHGRTADIDRPIAYEALGDDIAALMKNLGIEKADVMGYSLGAGTGLQMTIRRRQPSESSPSSQRSSREMDGIQKFSPRWRSKRLPSPSS